MCIQKDGFIYDVCVDNFFSDIQDLYSDTGKLNISEIENLLIKNLQPCMSQQEIADFTGLCRRSVRNKCGKLKLIYGLK